VNLQEAADLLGVHYQTAYRWVRNGTLPARKIHGAYDIDRSAVEALAHARATPVPPPSRATVRSWPEQVRRLLDHLLEGDETEALSLIEGLANRGVSVVDICERLISPVLYQVGELWVAGRVTIAEEHRASAICERALARRATPLRGRPRGVAVVASPVGELHALPGLMATAALRSDHWIVHHLGTAVPVAEVAELAERVGAHLVVVPVTLPAAKPAADELAAALDDRHIATLVGQPGEPLSLLLLAARHAGHESTTSDDAGRNPAG
jgi:excisionase family DNA binding protein